ncbi:trichohyalin-like isoform X2 [Oscarella lobularis]|uniref:trichohyalin-like isoform X2 n=1 Tax=Oscarella lobularis TaxID=121494 RepID=UPI0033136AB1
MDEGLPMSNESILRGMPQPMAESSVVASGGGEPSSLSILNLDDMNLSSGSSGIAELLAAQEEAHLGLKEEKPSESLRETSVVASGGGGGGGETSSILNLDEMLAKSEARKNLPKERAERPPPPPPRETSAAVASGAGGGRGGGGGEPSSLLNLDEMELSSVRMSGLPFASQLSVLEQSGVLRNLIKDQEKRSAALREYLLATGGKGEGGGGGGDEPSSLSLTTPPTLNLDELSISGLSQWQRERSRTAQRTERMGDASVIASAVVSGGEGQQPANPDDTSTSGIAELLAAQEGPGSSSPGQILMLVEQQRKYDALRRENFELKLRLYYLSQELERHGGNADSIDERDLQMNVDLQLVVNRLKDELKVKEELLMKAKRAMDDVVGNTDENVREVKRAAAAQLAELNARLTELGNAKTDLEQQKDGYFGRTMNLEQRCAKLEALAREREEEVARAKSREAEHLRKIEAMERELRNGNQLRDASARTREVEMRLSNLDAVADEIPLLREQLQEKEREARTFSDEVKARELAFKELQEEMKQLKLDHLNMIEQLKELQKATLEKTQEHYQNLLGQRNDSLVHLENEAARSEREHGERLKRLKEDLQAKIDSLKNALAEKDRQLLLLQSESSRKDTALKAQSTRTAKSTEALEDLGESLQEKDREIRRLQGWVQERDSRLEESQIERDELELRARAAEQQAEAVEGLKGQVLDLETAIHSSQAKYEEMQRKLRQKERELESMSGKKDLGASRLRNEFDSRIAAMKEQMEQNEEIAARKAQLLEGQYRSKTEALARKEELVNQLNRQLREKEIHAKELEAAVSTKSIALDEAEERSAAAVSERDMSISDLRQRIEAMKAHAAEQQAKVHRERDELKLANRRLQAELEAKAKDVEYMVQQNENKEKLIEALESEQQQMKGRGQSNSQKLSLERKERKQLEDYVGTLKAQVESAKGELEEVARQLTQSLTLNETLQRQLRDNEQKIKQLSSGRSAEANLVSDLRRQLDAARRQADSLRAQLNDAERANEAIRSSVGESATAARRQYAAENERLRSALTESRRVAESHIGGAEKLRQRLASSDAQVERLRAQLVEATNVNDRLQKRVEEFSAAAKAAGIHPDSGSPKKGSRLEQEIERLGRRLEDAERRNRSWEAEAAKARKRFESERRADDAEKMKEIGALKGKLAEAQKRIEVLGRQLRERKEKRTPVDLREQFREAMRCALELRERLREQMAQESRSGSPLDDLDLSRLSFFDDETTRAKEAAQRLRSQLEESSQLHASLQNELDRLERTLQNGAGDGDDTKSRRSLSPSIVVTDDVDEGASAENARGRDSTKIVTSTPNEGIGDALRSFKSHLDDSRSAFDSLRGQLEQFVSGSRHDGVADAASEERAKRAEAETEQLKRELEEMRGRMRRETTATAAAAKTFASSDVISGLKKQMDEGLIAVEGLNAQIRQRGGDEDDSQSLLENVDLLRSRLAKAQKLVQMVSTESRGGTNGKKRHLHLEEIIRKLKATDDMKLEATKSIYDQLARTHGALNRTKKNLQRFSQGDI